MQKKKERISQCLYVNFKHDTLSIFRNLTIKLGQFKPSIKIQLHFLEKSLTLRWELYQVIENPQLKFMIKTFESTYSGISKREIENKLKYK